jgi:hypothetical protein
MRPALAATGLLALLAACQTPSPPRVTCLPLKAYTPAQEAALAVQLAALPPGSELVQALIDYQVLRDADRACLAASSLARDRP